MTEIINYITEEMLQEDTAKSVENSTSLLVRVYEHMIKLHSVKNNLQDSDWIDSIRTARNQITDLKKGTTKNYDKGMDENQDWAFKQGLKKANSASNMIHKEIISMYPERPKEWTFKNIMDTKWMNRFIEDNIVSDMCETKFEGYGRNIEYRSPKD